MPGPGVVGLLRQHAAEVLQAVHDEGMLRAKERAALLVSLAREPFGRLQQSEAPVDRTHGVHQRRLYVRLRGQFAVDALGAAIEDLAGRYRVSQGFAGIRDLEEVHHEPRGLTSGLGLGFGSRPLTFGLVAREPGGHGERRGDGHSGDGRRRDNRHAHLAPVRLALLQIVEPHTEDTGDELELDVDPAVLARAGVGSDRLTALLRQLPIGAQPVHERRRKAVL